MQSDIAKTAFDELGMFFAMMDWHNNAPAWVKATNWNAQRFFRTGKCCGAYEVDDDPEDGPIDLDVADRYIYQLIWKDVDLGELATFLLIEMHIATGEFSFARDYWRTEADGLWAAHAYGSKEKTGMSWNRYRQLCKFFLLRKTLPEDIQQEPGHARKGKNQIQDTHG